MAPGPPWLVSGFRFRARLGFTIPSTFSGPRGITPAFGYGAPHPDARGTSTLLSNALPSAPYGPVRHPLAILPFPVDAGYRPDLLQRFLAGTRRASPVAQCVLVIVLSLTPRQSGSPHQSVCDTPCCLHPASKGSAFGASIFRGYFAFTSLRPDDLLTILKMALSIDESLVSLSPSILATRLPDSYLGGFDSH